MFKAYFSETPLLLITLLCSKLRRILATKIKDMLYCNPDK